MKLSVCIISFNEEKNIHIPIKSSYDFAEEIVLIDGGSSDETVEIAKAFGPKVKIFNLDNPKNFLANKQRAIEHAQGEWVLQLDADEALSGGLKKEIKDTLDKTRNYKGYWIPRKNWFLNRFLMKGGVYPDYVLRLYKRQGAKFDLKHLHENVQIEGEIGYLNNALLHYADPDFSRYILRWDRYTTFDAEKLLEKGKRIYFFDYFFIKPIYWFLKTYFRHKGFIDGFPGFIFSFFSSLRFCAIYIKYWTIKNKKDFKD